MTRVNATPAPWEGSDRFPRPPGYFDLRLAAAAVVAAVSLFEPNTTTAVMLGVFVYQSLGRRIRS